MNEAMTTDQVVQCLGNLGWQSPWINAKYVEAARVFVRGGVLVHAIGSDDIGDKQAAMSVLNDLETMAERVKANIITSAEAKIGELFADMPLTDHIDDYIRHLKERRVHPNRVKNTETRLKESATGCGFRFMRDLNADSLQRWRGEQVTGKRKMSG